MGHNCRIAFFVRPVGLKIPVKRIQDFMDLTLFAACLAQGRLKLGIRFLIEDLLLFQLQVVLVNLALLFGHWRAVLELLSAVA